MIYPIFILHDKFYLQVSKFIGFSQDPLLIFRFTLSSHANQYICRDMKIFHFKQQNDSLLAFLHL